MSRLPCIDFIVAGGHDTGLGHVVRSATLARETRRRGWRTRCFLRGDDAARSKWCELMDEDVDGAWDDLREMEQARPAIAALDFPFEKSAWLSRLSRTRYRVLAIDDDRIEGGVDWIVLPGLHHLASGNPTERTNPDAGPSHLSGPRYAILPDAHRRLGAQEKASPPRILLSMGGADPHRFTQALAGPLRNASRRASRHATTAPWAIDVVLGPAFDDPGDRVARSLAQSGMTVHRSPIASEMAPLMARARIAIIGFGTSLTELAWHRTPFLTVPHHDHDIAPARALESRGLGRLLATRDETREDPAALAPRIESALLDHGWQRESAAAAHATLEGGRGVARIISHIAESLESPLPSAGTSRVRSPLTSAAARPTS